MHATIDPRPAVRPVLPGRAWLLPAVAVTAAVLAWQVADPGAAPASSAQAVALPLVPPAPAAALPLEGDPSVPSARSVRFGADEPTDPVSTF